MLTLFCYVRDDTFTQTLRVEIDKAKSVSDLRKAIKEEKRPKFDDIPADLLVLGRLLFTVIKTSKKSRHPILSMATVCILLRSSLKISLIWKKRVHVIVDRQHSGELPPCLHFLS